eukprot:1123228-Prorocentrum_lima.AAC.1
MESQDGDNNPEHHMWREEVANAALPDSYYRDIHFDQRIRVVLDLLNQRQRRRVFGQPEQDEAERNPNTED